MLYTLAFFWLSLSVRSFSINIFQLYFVLPFLLPSWLSSIPCGGFFFSLSYLFGVFCPPLSVHAHVTCDMRINAGVTVYTLFNPFWVVKTRLQLQRQGGPGASAVRYSSAFDCFAKIVRHEGITALYRGLVASYVGALSCLIPPPPGRAPCKMSTYYIVHC